MFIILLYLSLSWCLCVLCLLGWGVVWWQSYHLTSLLQLCQSHLLCNHAIQCLSVFENANVLLPLCAASACEFSWSENDRLMILDALQGCVTLTMCCSVWGDLQHNAKFSISQAILSKPNLRATLVVGDKETAQFETAPPLLCLIMKGAIFRSSLAAASSAWLKLGKDLPGGFGAWWLTGRMTEWKTGCPVGCLLVSLVGWRTDWMTGHLKDEIAATHSVLVALVCCTKQPL